MSRRRLHVRRHAALLGVFVLLLGLFELNQWLPGGWPGGGGEGGFRVADTLRSDTSRVRPPLGEPPPWETTRVTISLRAPNGGAATGWRVATGDAEHEVDGEGRTVLPGTASLATGFALRGPDGRHVVHGPGVPDGRGAWTVHLPDDPLPEGLASGPVRLVLDVARAEDGAPLVGASVQWAGWGARGAGRTDAEGRYGADTDDARLHVTVAAPGRFGVRRWVDARSGPLALALLPRPAEAIRFVDAVDGSPVEVDHLRLLDADGVAWLDEAALLDVLGRRDRLLLDRVPGLPRVEGAVLEVGAPAHPVVRVPLAVAGEAIRLPRGRRVRVRPLDERGNLLAPRPVHAHYTPRGLGGAPAEFPEGREVVRVVEGPLSVPEGVPVRLLVQGGASAPRAHDLPAGDEAERVDVRLPPGGRLAVRVTQGPEAAPVSGAVVVLVAAVDGLRLERRAATDAEGRHRFAELPRGWVEVYAKGPGSAWAVATHEVGDEESEVSLALQPASSLSLIVETPLGLPVEGVRVQADPEQEGAPDVVPPHADALRTDDEGVLVLGGLLDRAYRLRLSRPGYRSQVIRNVRPGPGLHFATLVPE